jgi:hypothetical protein
MSACITKALDPTAEPWSLDDPCRLAIIPAPRRAEPWRARAATAAAVDAATEQSLHTATGTQPYRGSAEFKFKPSVNPS